MDQKDVILFLVGAALGWYVVRHRVKTGQNA
jgi:hypothetical protein